MSSLDIIIRERGEESLLNLIVDKGDVFTEYVDDELFFSNIMKIIDSINLNEREKKVVVMRFGLDDGRRKTLDEVGDVLRISRESVIHNEKNALEKIRKNIKIWDYFEFNYSLDFSNNSNNTNKLCKGKRF